MKDHAMWNYLRAAGLALCLLSLTACSPDKPQFKSIDVTGADYARELSLTAKGNKVLAALQPIVQEVQTDILAPLNDADRACFIQLAQQVVLESA